MANGLGEVAELYALDFGRHTVEHREQRHPRLGRHHGLGDLARGAAQGVVGPPVLFEDKAGWMTEARTPVSSRRVQQFGYRARHGNAPTARHHHP
ncbi:MAG TPA: hypothetical protein VHN14_03340 [Kofleriaceae bacterium]|nr:hypothetical protein [Kofleriaceae bacterium]